MAIRVELIIILPGRIDHTISAIADTTIKGKIMTESAADEQLFLFHKAVNTPYFQNLDSRQKAIAEEVISRAVDSPLKVNMIAKELRNQLQSYDVLNRYAHIAALVGLECMRNALFHDSSNDEPDVDLAHVPADYEARRESLLKAVQKAEESGNELSAERMRARVVELDSRYVREAIAHEFNKTHRQLHSQAVMRY
ncbi:MAG: hypothetical protein ABFR19_04190 [Pseudomonadota bacterium]